jgi:CheY-like chemotaxis protein
LRFNRVSTLIILDIYLPTIDGFEINREIQKLATKPYIIAISQYASALDCMSYLGANETYSKNDIELIVQAVKAYFDTNSLA